MQHTHHVIDMPTGAEIEFHDLTGRVRELIAGSGIRQGQVIVSALHTTCAVTVNENEPRLLQDIPDAMLRLVPKDAEYRHNDIEARGMPDEPRNAHAHVIAMLLGSSQTLSVVDGEPVLGTWQSILFVELDGPRRRRAGVQILGQAY